MATKKWLHKIGLGVLAFCLILLTGCMDLGDYSDINDYYACYPNVTTYVNYERKSYSMDMFYSDSTVNDMVCNVDELAYQAISIYVAKKVSITDFNIFIASSLKSKLQIELYISNENLNVSKNEDTDKYEFTNMDALLHQSSVALNTTSEFEAVDLSFKTSDYLENMYLIMLFPDNLQDAKLSFRFTNILLRGLY